MATPLARASFDSTAGGGADRGDLPGARRSTASAAFARAEVGALGAIIDYLELTQKGRLPLLRPPVREAPGGLMQIDAATRRNLELTRSLSGGREGSLLAAIDRTATGAGRAAARGAAERRPRPTCRWSGRGRTRWRISTRRPSRARRRASCLRRVPDLERALSRLALDRGGPRDLAAIRDGLAQAERLRDGAGGRPARGAGRGARRRSAGTTS